MLVDEKSDSVYYCRERQRTKLSNIARIEIEDGFVRLMTLLKSRLRNFIKWDIQKTISCLYLLLLLVMAETDHRLEGGEEHFRDSRMV